MNCITACGAGVFCGKMAEDNYVTDTGVFNAIRINHTMQSVLLKLNDNWTNAANSATQAKTAGSTSTSFMKLTKKMKLFYLASTLNKLKNQIVKYNVKKLFQLWHVYHRENKIVKAIVDILFKVPQYDINTLRQEILQKNKKSLKNKKQRDATCREICQHADLLRVCDRKYVKYCLDHFNTNTATLKKKTPVIMCFNESDIDTMINACLYDKTFPIHLLPCTIVADIKKILKNKVPQ